MLHVLGLVRLGNSGSGQPGIVLRAAFDVRSVFCSVARGFLNVDWCNVSSANSCQTANVTSSGSMRRAEQYLARVLRPWTPSRLERARPSSVQRWLVAPSRRVPTARIPARTSTRLRSVTMPERWRLFFSFRIFWMRSSTR
jgi:hypothetical protein